MQKCLFCLVYALLFISSGCVAMEDPGSDGVEPAVSGVGAAFGPATIAGVWAGESNWNGAVKEIMVMIRKPVVERMVSPTGQAVLRKTEPAAEDGSRIAAPELTLNPGRKPKEPKAPKSEVLEPAKASEPSAVWEKVTDTGMVFWGWDIFIKAEENKPFFNIQIIFKENGPGRLEVFSQTGGKGEARFVQEGRERRIDVSMTHPMFKEKEIKGRFLYSGDKMSGHFIFLDKEGIFKLALDDSFAEDKKP